VNFLFFSPWPLYPILTGLELRYYHLSRALAEKHEVHVICMMTERPTRETAAHLAELYTSVKFILHRPSAPTKASRSLGVKLREFWNPPWDYFHEGEYSEEARQAIRSAIEKHNPDGIYTYGYSLRKYFEGITGIPIVYDIGDDPSVLYYRLIRHRSGLRNKVQAFKDWLVARRFEKRELGRLKEVVLISSDDARVFRRLCPKTNVTVIPNGVNSDFFKRGKGTEPEKPVLLFTGVMDYEPNVTAIRYFCNSIYPLVKRDIPEASLYIVGRNPSRSVMELADSKAGIIVTGGVDDIRDYFQEAQVYVCPLRSGAGIKNKILEAWSMELPVVATSMSCEGIDVEPGKDILVADRPDEFARRVVLLLTDGSLRGELSRNGRRKVERDYSWSSRADMVESIFRRMSRPL
jgi:glycosyltransferase involved in cell wall biosynthesis